MKNWLIIPLITMLATGSTALAHASLVFGELTTPVVSPDAVTGFTLRLHMMDALRTPIEDAIVDAEFRLMTEEETAALESDPDPDEPAAATSGIQAEDLELPDGDWFTFRLEEVRAGGNYAGEIVLPEAGTYQLIMRDTTYPQEDAVADLTVRIDGETAFESTLFIFPPTNIGGAKLTTWLIWLIAIPVTAGVWVTIATLNRKPADKAD